MPLRTPFATLAQFAPTPAHQLGFGAPAPSGVTLPIPYVSQALGNWCWAACAEMVSTNGSSQCSLAATILSNTCPPNPSTDDQTATEIQIVSVLQRAGAGHPGHLGGATASAPPLTSQQLQSELNQQRPVEIGWRYFDNSGLLVGGHVVIVYGYGVNSAGTQFDVHDPHLNTGSTSKMDYTQLSSPTGYNPLAARTTWTDAWTPLR